MTEKIRILHCVIGSMNVGGIETMLMELYRHIDRTRFQFDFVVHDYKKNTYEDEINALGGVLYRVPFYSKNPIEHKREFRKLLKEHTEYQMIHIHTTYAIMYTDAKIAKQLGRTVIVHSHNSRATKAHTLYHSLFMEKMARTADYRLSCSYIAGEWMYGKKYSYDIWKNAIEVEKFKFDSEIRKRMREEIGIEDDTLLLGNVARLSYQKNQALLLNIYAEYRKINPNSRLLLVGDGEDRGCLENRVKELKLTDYVIFTGNVNNVSDYLMAMDMFCLTSRWEGFGVAMVEAVTAGVVVVAPTLVDGLVKQLKHVGIVEQYADIQSWIAKIAEMKPLSESERQECYDEILKQGYDITSQVKTAEQFYAKIMGEL